MQLRRIRRGAVLLCTVVSILLQTVSVAAQPAKTIPDEPVPLGAFSVRVTSAPGTRVESTGAASIDYSNASEGYVMAKYTGGKSKIKLQLVGSNGVQYTYSMAPGRGWEAFPLTSGNGQYTVSVYENVTGQSYALAASASFNASITNSLSPYLYPNQYVNFSPSSQTVALGQQLAAGATGDLEILTRVYNWVVTNITYDFQKAATVQSGYVPNIDTIVAQRKGICFDYAAVIASMLRTQSIPTRMEVGYVTGGVYHAWISVYTPETGWIEKVIQFDGQNWRLMDPTFASMSNSSAEIMTFINNNSNYKKIYVY